MDTWFSSRETSMKDCMCCLYVCYIPSLLEEDLEMEIVSVSGELVCKNLYWLLLELKLVQHWFKQGPKNTCSTKPLTFEP